MFKRVYYQRIKERLEEPRKLIQIVMGPRQVGKTTVVKQVVKDVNIPILMFSADNVPDSSSNWITECWEGARRKIRMENLSECVLIIDEIQKIKGWSEAVKSLWDEDTWNDVPLKVLLLGSSRVLLEKGLSDSLAGRFETIKMSHWSFDEMREAFGFSLEQYVFYGGYPAASDFVSDIDRWSEYIRSSIIDASINKDILMDTIVSKPALLRQTFELSVTYSGEIVSYTKMIGQLQDAGNTTTLAAYLRLLSDCGLVCGLQKYAGDMARRRASIPKLQVYNNALRNVYSDVSFKDSIKDTRIWGRMFESAVGAYIVNQAFENQMDVFYWREGNLEVDYVVKWKGQLIAIEVKSNNDKGNKGLWAFRERFNPFDAFVVGKGGVPVEEFLSSNLKDYFKR